MALARSSGKVMVARFIPVVYHAGAPCGEVGEVGANGEDKANQEVNQDALPNRGKHLCYLTNFHVGTNESPFRSAPLLRHFLLWLVDAVWWEGASLPRCSRDHLRVPEGGGGNSRRNTIPVRARFPTCRRAFTHPDQSAAHGGHDRRQSDGRLCRPEVSRCRSGYGDRRVQSLDQLSRRDQRRYDRTRGRRNARPDTRARQQGSLPG